MPNVGLLVLRLWLEPRYFCACVAEVLTSIWSPVGTGVVFCVGFFLQTNR